MIHSYVFAEGSLHEVLIMGFLFVTSPISANFISKVNIHRKNCDVPPVPPEDQTWSTLAVPEEDRESAPAK
jgi:multicomponent K+:H+ antiporter subunit G